jgi:hypothetical protein
MSSKSPRRFSLIEMITDRFVLGILFGAFLAAAAISSYAHYRAEGVWWDWGWVDSFTQNAGTEMLGAFLTFLLIEVLVTRRRKLEEKSTATEELKRILIRQLGSKVHSEAIRAAEEIEANEWLDDGSLQSVNLFEAKLNGANLFSADLRYANLLFADLQGANLIGANLDQVHIRGTNLRGAKLRGAYLADVDIDSSTILPDGNNWEEGVDLSRFTDSNHRNYWLNEGDTKPEKRI